MQMFLHQSYQLANDIFLGAIFLFTQTPALDNGPVTPLLALNVTYGICHGGVNAAAA